MGKENKGIDIKLITMANYVRPPVVENKFQDWVLNGKNNEFYQYIIDRHNGSPTNSSINNSYIDLIYGRGLDFTNGASGVNDWARLQTILRPRELRKIIADWQIFGEYSWQVIETKGGELSSIEHLAKPNVVPAIANEDNEIESYWFSRDWKHRFKSENIPVNFPAFGTGGAMQIFVGKPYRVGKIYFSDPEYLSGLPYAEMEEEIANLNISSIKNGLSAGYIINVPDGINFTPEQKKQFEDKITEKLIGSPNASRFIISFNGREVEITITPFPVNDNIHKQWESLNDTATQKLLTAHRATSPSLVGVISSSGFSNTADEMDMAEAQLLKRVIKPKQDFLLQDLQETLMAYGINLDLFFKPLTEVDTQAPVEMSSHVCLSNEDMANALIEFGEDINTEEWILLSTTDVDYDTDDDLLGLIQFATSTGTARPNAKSSQDSADIVIRYRYAGNPFPERSFCLKMMLADKLYRKEDILQMNTSGINDGFGMGGSNSYSIWLHKGGGKLSTAFPNGTCKHRWQREIYLKRGGGVDVNSPLARTISTSEARRRGYKVPVNPTEVSITPHASDFEIPEL